MCHFQMLFPSEMTCEIFVRECSSSKHFRAWHSELVDLILRWLKLSTATLIKNVHGCLQIDNIMKRRRECVTGKGKRSLRDFMKVK